MTTRLRVSDLTASYRANGGRDVVVHRAGFTLEAGSVLGLAGESGCGKSTLALASIGYRHASLSITEGRSELDGTDLLALGDRELRKVWGRRIAFVGQSSSTALNPAIKVGKQVTEALRFHRGLGGGELRERLLDLLQSVGIPDPPAAAERYPHQFSGGQQQRLAIALALAAEPDVLILDEPTTGLDVTTQAKIAKLLRKLVDDTGVATLFVSHDLPLLGTLADRVAIMYAGEIVEVGQARAMVSHPVHPYTRALLGAVPGVRKRTGLAGIPGSPPAHVVLDSCSFAPRCSHATTICQDSHPPLEPALAADHCARCWRWSELADHRREAPPPFPRRGSADASVLEVTDLVCRYSPAAEPAVRGVSLTLSQGETVGIIGESGSGKSTLLRAIAGLHPPASGGVTLSGETLASSARARPREVLRAIQLVFQDPDSSLNPSHSVLDIVRRPLRLFRDDVPRGREEHEAEELIRAVKLPAGMLHRRPGELSGGQKQRVALARAFAARPTVLLCDEVTSALDASVQATIIELIMELSTRFGTTTVFVSHDLALVRTVATRALVLRDGVVCEEVETEKLFLAPTHPYTKELLDSVPDSAGMAAGGVSREG